MFVSLKTFGELYVMIKLLSIDSTYSTFFIQKIQNTQFGFDEINTRLVVVKVNELPLYVLLQVFFLFQFENMLLTY